MATASVTACGAATTETTTNTAESSDNKGTEDTTAESAESTGDSDSSADADKEDSDEDPIEDESNKIFGNTEPSKKEDYFLEFENIKETKRYFLNDKGLVYKHEDLKIIDNKIALNEELFKNDALVFNDSNIKTLTLKNSNNEEFVKLNFENFPYLGIWSKPSGAPFVCIEPWFGVADEQNSNQNLEDKKGIITLEKDEVFSCFYSIEI